MRFLTPDEMDALDDYGIERDEQCRDQVESEQETGKNKKSKSKSRGRDRIPSKHNSEVPGLDPVMGAVSGGIIGTSFGLIGIKVLVIAILVLMASIEMCNNPY